jgi:beta-lactamase regulating signal transducer with metallopeptidase domain/ankyrin repeat protein
MFDFSVIQSLAVTHLWQSVAIAAVLAVLLILGKRMSGAARYSLACAALAATVVLPIAAFLPGQAMLGALLDTLKAPTALVEAAPADMPVVAPVSPPADPVRLDPQAEAALGMIAQPAAAAAPVSSTAIALPAIPVERQAAWTLPTIRLPDLNLPDFTLPLMLVWAAGAILMLVRVGRDIVAVEKVAAGARPVDLPKALKRRMGDVRVAVSSDAPGPMAAGLLKPVVILPEEALTRLGSPDMEALLEHERAHIERRDVVAALAQRIGLALLWWSPAAYWISRRIDEEREVACDEAAVERTGDARAFARTLTSQAETQLWARAPRLAAGALGQRSQFGRRIKRLIALAKSNGVPKQYSGRVAFSALALAIMTAVFVTPRIVADTPDGKETPPPVDSALDGEATGRGLLGLGLGGDAGRYEEARYDSPPSDIEPMGDELDGASSRSQAFDARLNQKGAELEAMFAELGAMLEQSIAAEMPQLESEMHGLSMEMAQLGVEIGALASAEVMREMPLVMEQVQAQLEAEGIHVDFDGDQVRLDMDELRDEINNAMGPEMREEIRRAMEEAREEIRASRDELRAEMDERRAGMDAARAAMDAARAEIDRARARGEFERARNIPVHASFGVADDEASVDVELLHAADDGDVARVRELMGQGATANRLFRGDGSALIAAAREGHVSTVRALLDAGWKPDLVSPGDASALIAASREGQVAIVRMLLDAGANPNVSAPGDGNPLIAAADAGEVAVVRVLLDRGAKANAYVPGDETALINAAREGEMAIVRLLVERGADVNLAYRVNGKLRSPLGVAIARGHDDVADFLKARGAVAEPNPAN